ncbi:hypothetical protein QE370_000102 [Aeromicrobium sp. SORGH_AS981]|nr:hypothetical protein [Aeromicrobium sp. SORGH_AS_0981]
MHAGGVSLYRDRVGVQDRPAVRWRRWSVAEWSRSVAATPHCDGSSAAQRSFVARAATRPAERLAGRVPPRAPARGGVSRPLRAVAGGWFALGCCRVVSIRGTALLRRACRYSTSGTSRWSSASTSASEGRCIETTPGCRWGLVRAGLLPGGLDTRHGAPSSRVPLLDQRNVSLVECLHERQRGEVYRDHSGLSLGVGSRWAVAGWSRYAARRSFVARAATRPAECLAGRVPPRAPARGGVSRPLRAVAGGWFALGCCRVVSMRSTALLRRACRYSTSGTSRWSSSRAWRGTSLGPTYRDHSALSLGVGSR